MVDAALLILAQEETVEPVVDGICALPQILGRGRVPFQWHRIERLTPHLKSFLRPCSATYRESFVGFLHLDPDHPLSGKARKLLFPSEAVNTNTVLGPGGRFLKCSEEQKAGLKF